LKIRIGTRKSQLALWQANHIADLIKKYWNVEVEIVKITTSGDKILDVPLAKIGGKGLFVKEIEEAMLKGEVDIAVHSLKDVPTQLPEGLGIVAITKREDPRDAFLSTKYKSLYQLPVGSIVGTSSLRRKSQIMRLRPDLNIKDLRGNVDTRIKKLEEGHYDAIILAYAGLKRLNLDAKVSNIFSPEEMIPAVCQGFLGIEARIDDDKVRKILEPINDKESFIRATAERTFLKTLEGGCQVPLGSYCEITDDEIKISGFIADLEGKRFIKETLKEKLKDDTLQQANELGERLANILIEKGGKEILTQIYNL
jgi:hydroxymethylbilane synthase